MIHLDELGNEHRVHRDQHDDHPQTREHHEQRACGAHFAIIGVSDRAEDAENNRDAIENAAENECAAG
eukprot:CAMPEP_0197074768 /NCGR_PEP_ID=MMETSP1384-20130603/211274_1 /TAXON_ID=29189 /ORGANISM="Ammonia sp." /LENGTH=67 /DNA_ID=CAMNT_0042513609 /DNA_START=371 /DNA_END=574 /DNA_ORIENTATION=+